MKRAFQKIYLKALQISENQQYLQSLNWFVFFMGGGLFFFLTNKLLIFFSEQWQCNAR